MPRVRRTKATMTADRARIWGNLRHEGFNLWTLCLACGTMNHCRGRVRDTIKCEGCFNSGAKLKFDVLHGERGENDIHAHDEDSEA